MKKELRNSNFNCYIWSPGEVWFLALHQTLFNAPELKAQVHYCDHALSIVRRPSVRPSLAFPIFDFFSKTSERNSTKLDRKQDLNVLYQVFVFQADRKKQDDRSDLLLADTFLICPLKSLNRIQRNMTESKISKSSTRLVFFRPIGKTRWPPWPLICWGIFDLNSEIAEENSTTLDRKQDLNVLYPVCVCRADRKNKIDTLASDLLIHLTSPLKRNSMKLDRKKDLNAPYQVCVFRADRKKNKMAALASDCLIYFRLLLWNRWTKFNETWQEARSELPLPSLCFWDDRRTRWPPGF